MNYEFISFYTSSQFRKPILLCFLSLVFLLLSYTSAYSGQAPALDPIADITVNEGDTVTLDPTATDPDGDTLTYTYSGWMTSASYTTNYDDSGTHAVTVTVSDGSLTDSQDVTITVNNVNRIPLLDTIADITVNEGDTVTLDPTATDPDGDTLTYTYSDWMTSASYTTNYDDSGTHAVTVMVSDGSLTDSQDVTITVNNVNRIPLLDTIADIMVNEGETITITPMAADPDGDTLTFSYSGWMTSNTYTTISGDAGTYAVTVTVSDGELTDSQDVNITVIGSNSAPEIDQIGGTSFVDKPITLSWSPNTESDIAGYKIYYGSSSGSYNVIVDVSNQTSYTISGLVGGNTYYITLTAYDINRNESSYSSEVVYVAKAVNVGVTVNEGETITLNPTATDPDEDTLTYTYSGWMTSASYTTNYDDSGAHTVTVTVSDGSLTDSQDVMITINNVNRAPVLDTISPITVNEGDTATLSPTATDEDGDTLTFSYSGWMTSASYTTNYDDSGTHTVTVTVSDGSLTDSQDVTITVNDGDSNDGGGSGGGGGNSGGAEELTCEYTISPEEETFTSEGGTGSVDISTEDGCEWTATSNNGWIIITSGSGSGVGTIEYTVSENTSESSRTSYITITGDDYTATVTVTQDGATDDGDDGGGGGDNDDNDDNDDGDDGGGGGDQCAYSLSSTEESFTSDSGTDSLSVITDEDCYWTAVSNKTDWITVTKVTYAIATTGNGTIEYSVSENTGIDLRTGYITITGNDYTETFKVTQAAPESLTPDIKANNSDGPITIGTDGNLSIKISLSAADHVGEEADWWLVANTPSGLESYALDQGFVPGLAVTYQGVIFDLDSITVFDTSGLDAGTYVYYFGIDLDMDGNLDMDEGLLYNDSVEVTVEEGAGGGGLSSPTGFIASADGTTVTLSWDAVDEAEGYRLYYGYSSGKYSGTSDLGNSIGMVFENVPEGTYYLAITAYADSDESGHSSEASVTVH